MTDESEKPSAEIQRQIIEQKRSQFRAMGFEAELEIATLKIQKAGREEERQRAKTLVDLRDKANNCYASATELTRLLSELPEPPKAEA